MAVKAKHFAALSLIGLAVINADPALSLPVSPDHGLLKLGTQLNGSSRIIRVDTGDGANVTLARKLQRRLRAEAKANGRDPSRIYVDPSTVPYNINRSYVTKTYGKLIGRRQ